MLSQRAREAVARASPANNVLLIVSVKVPDESALHIGELSARADALYALYEKAKKTVLNGLNKYRDDGVRIIATLDGTPQVIVTAPAKAWQKLIEEEAPVLFDPKVEFGTSDPLWRLEPPP